MTKKFRSEEFKQQILRECDEVGNMSLVARRYSISLSTIHIWRKKTAQRGTVEALPREATARLKELENRLQKTATNSTLKRICGRKGARTSYTTGNEGSYKPSVADKVGLAHRWIE